MLPQNVKMVAIQKVLQTASYKYGTKWNETTSKFKMLYNTSNDTNHLEFQSFF